MVDIRRLLPALLAYFLAVLLGACGQTGDLYLPQPEGEVVTRPTQTPPQPEPDQTSNSPQTADSPAVPATPAPEVTEPEDEKPKQQPLPPPSTRP